MSLGATPPTPEPHEALGALSRRSFVVAPEAAGARLDRFLQARAPDLSRTRLQALITAGHVQVTGGHAKASHRLQAGAQVTVLVPPPEPLELTPEAIPLDVVYEDADLLVVNKPVGLVVHPGAGHRTGTLVHALLAHCGLRLSGIGGARRPGIVHRLDRGTSGLLMVAKNDRAHLGLARQLKARTVERRYLALVHGGPPHAAGVVESAIGRDPGDRLRMAVRPAGAGRPALTRYRVLERFPRLGPLTLLEVTLGTGRTHQIRVHLAHLGAPVVGDRTYRRRDAMAPDAAVAARVAGLGGQALHAAVLGFTHPATGATLRFEAPPPPAFAALLAWLREPSGTSGTTGARPDARVR
ncbi:MAG TPA: RluA family pseudouridine synthase [Methylomirabilota bacterium]|nr:RluA family pseudouridine synthase [Methylomirabilota bacterium]